MKLPYSKQYIDKKDINEVVKCLKSDFVTQGPYIEKFEKKISKYVGSKYAVAVSSCTAGLHIALKAINFSNNDKLLTSIISFVSTANVSQFLDGKVDFVDINLDTISLNLEMLKKKIDKNVKAIIPVHISGAAYNEKEIYKVAKEKKVFVIEDCAHALGGEYSDGTKIGSCKYSDMSVFSFHPVKSITTGEGGVITTNNKEIYKKLLRLRSHGINKVNDKFINKELAFTKRKKNPWYYEMRELGYHYRITDIQCALGLTQLDKLNNFIKKRRELSRYYDDELKKIFGLNLSQISMRKNTAAHIYVIRINYKFFSTTRQEFMAYMRNKNIYCQVHYMPICMHPYYKNKGFRIENFPNAKKYYDECISIPCYYSLSVKEQKFVIHHIKNFFYNKKVNLLLFGGSGLLGSNILKMNKSNFNIFTYLNKKNIGRKFSKSVKFNLNIKFLKKFIYEKNISIIINASGLTSLEECESKRNLAIKSNVKIISTILNSIQNTDVKLVHISTDQIFDKKRGKIAESEKLVFKNYYAKTKVLAENQIKKLNPKSLIIRSNFFGKGTVYRNSYSDYIVKNLQRKNFIPIWSNINFSPVSLNTLVKCLFKMINRNISGVFNISSNQKISKFKFANKIAELKKLDKKFIIPKKFDNKREKIDRPLNMFLNNKKLLDLFPELEKELDLSKQIQKKLI